MSNRIIIAGVLWVAIFTAIVIAGCSPESGMEIVRAAAVDVLHNGLRIRRDEARNRIWLLGVNDVRVYDARSKRLIRKIALPGWSVARFACDPDMVLDGSGSAIISSNVQARLWLIDEGSFEVNERQITLREREHWDVGFGALVPAGAGKLLALTSLAGSLWSIDLGKGSAKMVAPTAALSNPCSLAPTAPGQAGAAGTGYTAGSAGGGSEHITRRQNP